MNKSLFPFILLLLPVFLLAQLERDSVMVLLDDDNLYKIEFADLDGDGDLDYVAGLLGHNGNVQVFFNTDGQGNYSTPVTYGDTTWLEYPNATRDFDLGDMDNDGDIDIVPGYLASGSLPYLSNDGTGTFSYLGDPTETVPLADYHYLKVADLDQDGQLDVVSFRTGARSLFLNRNLGNGQDFETMEIYDGFDDFAPHYVSDFLLFDYDADGDLDLAFLSIESDPNPEIPEDLRLSIYEQTCSLCYVARESDILATGNKYIYTPNFVAGDLNGDNLPDLAVTFQFENSPMEEVNQLLVLQNEAGSSSFTEIYEQEHVSKVSLTDIDLDEDLDIFAYHLERGENAGSINRRHYSIGYNLGDFNFSSVEIDERYSGDKLSCVDINQDNRPDLVTLATTFSGLITARINTPLLSFDSAHYLNLAFGTIDQIQPEDWNEDGLMDIFFFGSAGVDDVFYDGIYRIDQSAEGVFESPQLVYQLEGPGNPKVFIDLNNDGNLDAVGVENIYGSTLGRRLVFVLQETDGSWSNGLAIAPEEMDAPNYYTVQDWDLDGDPDIIAISYTDNFYFLENQLSTGNAFVVHPLDLEYDGASYYRQQLESGDFNTDGYPDIMLKLSNELFWARGQNSTPSFPSWDTIPVPEGFDYSEFFLADFNQDGYTDILANFQNAEFNYRLRAISFFDPDSDNFSSFLRIHRLSNVVGLGLVDDFNGDSSPDYSDFHGIRLNLDKGQLFTAPTLPSPLEDRWFQQYVEHAKITQFTPDGPRYMVAGIWSIIAHSLEYLDHSTLSGSIRWDTTGQCQYDTIFPALSNWQVAITSAEQESMAVSGFDGRYGAVFSDTGAYEITVLPPSGYWQVCPPDTLLQVSNDTSSYVADFAANALVDCPLMVVELSSTIVSQCFGSAVSLGFRNAGTAPAEDVTIVLQHDFRLVPVSSSSPWSVATDTSVTFELGLIDVGEYGQISVHFEPSCEELILGEQVCFIAEVSPNELCEEM